MLDLNFGELQVPVAVFVPNEFINSPRRIIEAIVSERLLDLGFGALQYRDDPAVGQRELEISLGISGRTLTRCMRFKPAILTLTLHEHKTRCVPELIAEIAVTLATIQVEIQGPREGCQRGERKSHGIGAKGWDAVRVVLAQRAFDFVPMVRSQQPSRTFCDQSFQIDSIDQIEWVDRVALGLGHFLAFGIANDGVDINVPERHLAREVFGHHDHPGDPEEDDVKACDQDRAGQIALEFWCVLRPSQG